VKKFLEVKELQNLKNFTVSGMEKLKVTYSYVKKIPFLEQDSREY